jgi:hypothetical protein
MYYSGHGILANIFLTFTVTVPKGLFTLYVNVKIVTAKIVWPP